MVATPSPSWMWHLGAIDRKGRVWHFKRTREGQPFAPFWFEGQVRHTDLEALLRTGKVLWIGRAWRVVPYLLLLVIVLAPLYLLAFALYWPCWMAWDSVVALRKGFRLARKAD